MEDRCVTVHLPEGWLTEKEAQELAKLAHGKRVLEMGAFKGRATTAMSLTAQLVVSVDWHKGDKHVELMPSLPEYTENVKHLRNVVPIVGRFQDVIPMLIACPFDMVFIDGQHDRASVQRDMVYALALGPSVIAVHDWGLFEVAPAITSMGMEPDYLCSTLAIFNIGADAPPVHLIMREQPHA